MSAIEIKQLKDKIEKLTQELWALENEEEEEKCWTCGVLCVATHKTYRDALGEFELTCDKCYREEYPEEYEEEEVEEELTWQEKINNYDMLVDACRPIAFTKDEDLVVGDIVEHSFGCRDYKLMCVDRLTEKTIWYKECWTEKHRVRDSGGDEHTYGKFLGRELANGLNYKRKRHTKVLDNPRDEKWRGQRVYKYPNCGNIWIKEEESDIWR